jgi:hypothetical protein
MAGGSITEQGQTACCYARSEKSTSCSCAPATRRGRSWQKPS